MESVEVTVRRMKPQPVAIVPTEQYQKWVQALFDYLADLDARRASNHPLGPRLQNMASFIAEQTKLIAHNEADKCTLKAGEFHWFLCKLEQRQEGMKAQLQSGDPFITAIDPGLRRLIKQGWDLPKWPRGYWKMADRLHQTMVAGRER